MAKNAFPPLSPYPSIKKLIRAHRCDPCVEPRGFKKKIVKKLHPEPSKSPRETPILTFSFLVLYCRDRNPNRSLKSISNRTDRKNVSILGGVHPLISTTIPEYLDYDTSIKTTLFPPHPSIQHSMCCTSVMPHPPHHVASSHWPTCLTFSSYHLFQLMQHLHSFFYPSIY